MCIHACNDNNNMVGSINYTYAGSQAIQSTTQSDLSCEIKQRDLPILAGYFDDIEYYLDALELSPPEKTDVRKAARDHGTQVGMNQCLALWQQHNPSTATFFALVDILLKLRKGDIAVKVREYLQTRSLES